MTGDGPALCAWSARLTGHGYPPQAELVKEAALAKIKPLDGQKAGRYKPADPLLAFLDAL